MFLFTISFFKILKPMGAFFHYLFQPFFTRLQKMMNLQFLDFLSKILIFLIVTEKLIFQLNLKNYFRSVNKSKIIKAKDLNILK